MEPHANDGDYAVSTRIFFKIREGDVLVFRSPLDNAILIKRVKSIEMSGEGPRYFMEGDNRMRSTDSRKFGPVGRNSIVAKVIHIARKNRSK